MYKKSKSALALSVGAYALIAVSAAALTTGYSVFLAQPAHAAGDGSGGGGGHGGGGGGGGHDGGDGGDGHDSGSHDSGGGSGSTTHGPKGGKGGPSADSDGKGPKAGAQGKNSTAGKPSWSQEGIPEVELGRLNVARSPEKVLDRALAEALANWSPANSALYSMTAAQFADYVKANWDSLSIVDSPVQNLGLLNALFDGTLNLSSIGVTPASKIDLGAILLGVASDKTVPISTDTAVALNTILDLGLSASQTESLAAKAEVVRQAVLEGHG